MQARTPITLITGSLGSGKTTLLKRIIAAADRKLAVLMNEFGELAIDSRIIEGEHTRIIELPGGCVCCELAGELITAVNELLDKYQPEIIVLEATGVAEADALVYEVEDNLPQVRLDSVICVVDAYTSIKYPQVGYVGRVQLQQADIILINKTDLVSPSQIAEITRQARQFNPNAAVIPTEHCAGVQTLLFEGRAGGAKRPAAAGHPHVAELQTFTYTSDRSMDRAAFGNWADSLPPAVYRAKGFVVLDSRSYLFNKVAGRWDLEEFKIENTRLVFIGPRVIGLQDEIAGGLKQCER